MLLVALIALGFYVWGVRSSWRNPTLVQAEKELAAEAVAEESAEAELAEVK
ncbi:hypothetical protein GCM10020000_28950 [Streptomyces olivoverticillatus]